MKTWWGPALAVLLFASCAEPAPSEVWFAPNLGSEDMIGLFTAPQEWRTARGSTHVVKFYAQQVLADHARECPDCGPNLYPALVRAGAFTRLQSWGIAIAVEAGALKPWGCVPGATLPLALEAVRRIESRKAEVQYLALDEPLLGAQACDFTLEEAALHTAAFAREAVAERPHLRVGDIEPYPAFSAAQLLDWLAALRRHGFRPAFFHLDVDRTHAARVKADVTADLRTLRTEVEAQGIPFGVIFWSDVGTTEHAYFDDAAAWIETVATTIGEPTHSVFQSWVGSASGRLTLPPNLPEDDARSFTHTRLLNHGLARLRGRPGPPLR